ncbi:MAG: peptide deformylase [Campylobacterota bacterium]|nr:peptide deformylase [Campylobacterota bacterium]
MIKELVIYPDQRVNIACTDVRKFDEKLHEVLQNMKDTMQAHHLEALSAIQIAMPYNIIVIKCDDIYMEFINPRIIKAEGNIRSLEKTLYYPNIEQTIPRYGKIKLIYEDRSGNVNYMDISDTTLSTTLQRKIDYLFGGTFLDKLDKGHRQNVIDALAKDGLMPRIEVCPAFSKKDYFVSFADKLLFLMGLSLLSPLFNFSKETMQVFYILDKIFFPAVILLMIGFFFYAQYEAKQYKQCSSCQIGNNIGVIIKRSVAAIILLAGSYFLVNPN